MKYLCLIYYDENEIQYLKHTDQERLTAERTEYVESLKTSCHMILVEDLQPIQSATTLRVRDGRLTLTDGPYAETQEQLESVLLIEARDLNEAIRVASKNPAAQFGCIEIRPVFDRTSSQDQSHVREDGVLPWR